MNIIANSIFVDNQEEVCSLFEQLVEKEYIIEAI